MQRPGRRTAASSSRRCLRAGTGQDYAVAVDGLATAVVVQFMVSGRVAGGDCLRVICFVSALREALGIIAYAIRVRDRQDSGPILHEKTENHNQ